MDVNQELIAHVQRLARLELSAKEQALFVEDFSEVLRVFDVLAEAEVPEGTSKTTQPVLDARKPLRVDKPRSCLSQEKALGFTKDSEDGYFVGPRANK